ncbi:MAG: tripartite tricarboxylate transporter TctB family protein [Xanthobacteraceae bacterium]
MKQVLRPTPFMAIVLAIVAMVFASGGYGLGLWQDEMPSAGLLPFVTALLLLPLTLRIFCERPADETAFNRRPLGAVLLLACYAATLPVLGFVIPTMIMIIIWIKALDGQPLLSTATVAVILTLAGAFLFVKLLQVPMPLLPRIL